MTDEQTQPIVTQEPVGTYNLCVIGDSECEACE